MYLRIKKQFQNWCAHSAEKLKRSDLDTHTATVQGEKMMTFTGTRTTITETQRKNAGRLQVPKNVFQSFLNYQSNVKHRLK